MEDSEKVAKARGATIVYPRANELFIDIDSEKAWSRFHEVVVQFKALLPCIVTFEPSISGKPYHYHMIVRLRRPVKDEFERILLQAVLGTDPDHTALTWQRAMLGDPRPTLRFVKRSST